MSLDNPNAPSPEQSARLERAEAAWQALVSCHPEDAAQLCAGFLDGMQTGGPVMGDLLGTAVADARFWADAAPVHEVAAYGVAALDRLRSSALGINTRKRLFAALWQSFDKPSRLAFISKVDADGKFLKGAE